MPDQAPIDPDCRDGKHAACIGSTWDDNTDRTVDCTCQCHVVGGRS